MSDGRWTAAGGGREGCDVPGCAETDALLSALAEQTWREYVGDAAQGGKTQEQQQREERT